jgi:septum site-determining protein MinC
MGLVKNNKRRQKHNMQRNILEFKGLKKGLYAIYKGADRFEDFLQALEGKLDGAGDFFAGACMAGVYGIELSEIEEDILGDLLKGRYKMEIKVPLLNKDTVSRSGIIADFGTRFVKSTLRSGQSVSCEGNVVVLGDVNAGAEVEAGGSIVVMGSLRGTARAGVPDRNEAIISAISLQPTQLKIGKVVVRWPDEERYADEPEIAYVQQDVMYVRPLSDIK